MNRDPTKTMARTAASPSRSSSKRFDWRSVSPYIIGNAGALFVGLVVTYFSLVWSGTASGDLISIKTVDFMEYYSAARLIVEGHGGHLYDFAMLGHLQASLTYPLGTPYGVLPYLYPSYLAVALAPLSLLPYTVDYLLWLVLDCLLLASAMYALEQYTGLHGRKAALMRLSALCFLPVFMALGLGQVSILLLALFTAVFFAARAERDTLCGAVLALAIIKPPYVLPFLIALLVRKRWRAVAAFGVTSAVLLLAPLPIMGASINQTYLRTLLDVTRWQGRTAAVAYHHVLVAPATYAATWNHSFAGFAQLALSAPMSTMATMALNCLAILFLIWSALRFHRIDIPLALAVIVALLISPHTLAYDLTLLLIPVAVAIREKPRGPRALVPLLIAGYLMITVGYKLAFFVPLQLSVVAMSALGVWLFLAGKWDESPAMDPAQGAPTSPSTAEGSVLEIRTSHTHFREEF